MPFWCESTEITNQILSFLIHLLLPQCQLSNGRIMYAVQCTTNQQMHRGHCDKQCSTNRVRCRTILTPLQQGITFWTAKLLGQSGQRIDRFGHVATDSQEICRRLLRLLRNIPAEQSSAAKMTNLLRSRQISLTSELHTCCAKKFSCLQHTRYTQKQCYMPYAITNRHDVEHLDNNAHQITVKSQLRCSGERRNGKIL